MLIMIAVICFSCQIEESFDADGIPYSAYSNGKYAKYITKIIQNEKVYSERLYRLLEKHFLRPGDKNEYVSFYKLMVDTEKTPDIRVAFQNRYVRGLILLGKKEEAVRYLKTIENTSLQKNQNEYLYYMFLKRYLCKSGKEQKHWLEICSQECQRRKRTGYEEALVFSALGNLYKDTEVEKALEYYKTGILHSHSQFEMDILIKDIKSLVKKYPEKKQTISGDLFEFCRKIDRTQMRVWLIFRIVEDSIPSDSVFSIDDRYIRKLMDDLYSDIDKFDEPYLQGVILAVLGVKEGQLGNLEDADRNLAKSEAILRRIGMRTLSIGIHSGRLLIKTYYLFDTSSKSLDKSINGIAKLVRTGNKEDFIFIQIPIDTAIKTKAWKSYDYAVNLAKSKRINNPLTVYIAYSILPELFGNLSKYTNSEIRHVATSVDDQMIALLPSDWRAYISVQLASINEYSLMKKWLPDSNNDFATKMRMIELVMISGTNKDFHMAVDKLMNIVPRPFKFDDDDFSSDDAEIWRLITLLNCYTALRDFEKIEQMIPKISRLQSSCTPSFIKANKRYIDCSLGSAKCLVGSNIDDAMSLLQNASKELPQQSIDDAKIKLYLGIALLKKGLQKEAENEFLSSLAISTRHSNSYLFLQNSILLAYLAYISTQKDQPLDKFASILKNAYSFVKNLDEYPDELTMMHTLSIWSMQRNKNLSRNEKKIQFDKLYKNAVSTSRNSYVLLHAYQTVIQSKYDNNYPVSEIIEDIERYFHYYKLVTVYLKDSFDIQFYGKQYNDMKSLLFNLLNESRDTAKIDYWNKIFERDRTRTAELQSQQIKADTKLLPLLTLITKFENAQQILAHEQSKKESEQDKLLIQKALKLKREIEQQYELARKNLSAKDLKLFEALLSDNFIIHPDSLSQLSSILPTGTACLQFLNVGENIIAYIAVKDTPPFTISISLRDKGLTQKKFSQKLIKVRNLLQNKANVSTVNKELAELYSVLFSEIEKPLEKLNVKSIVVNASGILRYVPMATLYDGKKYLIEKYQISNITGLDLIRLSKSNGKRTISDVKAAIFADPDGSLPSGRSEGQSIAQFFANKRLYLGDKASLAEFESMVGNVNFVHLAIHAVLDPNEPGKSYIQFADGKKWYYSDMMGFNIRNVDSIALSACETAVSEKSTGGEIEGMAYQLLKKSPSGSVLASFWKVDDTATAMLMGIYYKHVTDSIKASHTLDRGGALREAQLKLLKNPDTSHPYYWAAFTLFGDFR